ncbi:MAG TPA: DUF58 domain-containing protein [Verrucomicrobiae bacterium]|nr:DUF58 domain-containing protein [Verrucomicrobiae bacterium]
MSRAAGVALAGAALILAAFVFDSSGLFVPGIAFVGLAVSVPGWIWLASRGASVSRRLDAERVVEDEPLEARIVVRRGALGLPGGEVLDPFAGGAIRLSGSLSNSAGRRVSEVRVVARFPRRGRRRFDPPTLTLGDPIGLVHVHARRRVAAEALLVLPRTERLRWHRRDPGHRVEAPSGSASPDALAATEVDGLRPYRPGTPASRISWTALARGAGLLERRLRAERDSGPLVVLDVRASADGEHVDAAVRAAASLALELARRTGCDLLLPGDRRPLQIEPDLGAWPGAHARLALVEGGPDAPPPSMSIRPGAGTIFYVAAESGRLPARLLRGSLRAGVLVLPEDLTPAVRGVPSFDVGGCRGYVLTASSRTAPPRERVA